MTTKVATAARPEPEHVLGPRFTGDAYDALRCGGVTVAVRSVAPTAVVTEADCPCETHVAIRVLAASHEELRSLPGTTVAEGRAIVRRNARAVARYRAAIENHDPDVCPWARGQRPPVHPLRCEGCGREFTELEMASLPRVTTPLDYIAPLDSDENEAEQSAAPYTARLLRIMYGDGTAEHRDADDLRVPPATSGQTWSEVNGCE